MPDTVMARFSNLARSFIAADAGSVTIEFALVSLVFLYILLNGAEVARWYAQRTEVSNAVHASAQAVLKTCDVSQLPATVKCSGMNTAITNSLQSTSLGSSVMISSGYPTEAYYCINSSGALIQVGTTANAKPADCSAVGDATRAPGDYVYVAAAYTFAPMISGITIGDRMPTTMTATGFIRLQ